MKLRQIYNLRKSLIKNSRYLWSNNSHRHIIFKKLTDDVDEIYYKYQFIGVVRYLPVSELCIFNFRHRLNDYKNSNGCVEINKTNNDDITMNYVTRCYQTRHGHGPMTSSKKIKLHNNKAETNVYNKWQTEFRIAELDLATLKYALDVDGQY